MVIEKAIEFDVKDAREFFGHLLRRVYYYDNDGRRRQGGYVEYPELIDNRSVIDKHSIVVGKVRIRNSVIREFSFISNDLTGMIYDDEPKEEEDIAAIKDSDITTCIICSSCYPYKITGSVLDKCYLEETNIHRSVIQYCVIVNSSLKNCNDGNHHHGSIIVDSELSRRFPKTRDSYLFWVNSNELIRFPKHSYLPDGSYVVRHCDEEMGDQIKYLKFNRITGKYSEMSILKEKTPFFYIPSEKDMIFCNTRTADIFYTNPGVPITHSHVWSEGSKELKESVCDGFRALHNMTHADELYLFGLDARMRKIQKYLTMGSKMNRPYFEDLKDPRIEWSEVLSEDLKHCKEWYEAKKELEKYKK